MSAGSRLLDVLQSAMLMPLLADRPCRPDVKQLPWPMYTYAAVTTAMTALFEWGSWAAAAICAAALAVPAIPTISVARTRRRHRGRYISHVALSPEYRLLLTRTPNATGSAARAWQHLGGLTENPQPTLKWHEREIAQALAAINRHTVTGAPGSARYRRRRHRPHRRSRTYATAMQKAAAAAWCRDHNKAATSPYDDGTADFASGRWARHPHHPARRGHCRRPYPHRRSPRHHRPHPGTAGIGPVVATPVRKDPDAGA